MPLAELPGWSGGHGGLAYATTLLYVKVDFVKHFTITSNAFYVNRDPLLETGLPANPPGYNFFRDQLRQGGSR